ncbi:MAG: hypothetical protein ACRECO_22540 [Xanthobacteraceae bacterium]
MVEFDHLPPTSRSLILATLALDIVSRNCRSIFDLALRRNQTVKDVWRDICRRTAQPHCTMPRQVLESQYTGTSFPPAPAAAATFPAAAPAAASPASTSAAAPARILPEHATGPNVIQLGDLIAIPSDEPVTTPPPLHGHDVPKWQFMMAAGLAAIVLIAAGVAIVIATPDPAQTTAARFDGPVLAGGASSDAAARTVGAGSGADAVSVPAPQGTLHRMDAISKAFSKQ